MAASTFPGFMPPPPGVTPDLNNPDDAKHSLLLGWLITWAVLTTVFFFARAYTKIWILHSIFLEDVTCAVAWVLFAVYAATTAVSLHYGQGYHAWEVSPENYSEIRKWLYAGTIVYCPASYFTKVTLLLIIARIFTVRERVAKSIYIFIITLLVAYLPIQFLKIFICSPIRAYWETSANGSCLNQDQIFMADISLAILTDFVILIIPIPLTWSLQAPMGKKIKIIMFLGAGGAATAATTYRQWLTIQFMHTKDATVDFAIIVINVLCELGIGLICSCLPSTNIMKERYKVPQSSHFRRFLGSISDIILLKRGSTKSDEPSNFTSLVTIGRISNRNEGSLRQPDADLGGSFEHLEDGSLQGSTDDLYGNWRGTTKFQSHGTRCDT